MKFEDLGLAAVGDSIEVPVTESVSLAVRKYLPIDEKAEFIEYVASNSMDLNNGTFSPLRVATYFDIAVCKWYADIEFEDGASVSEIYDIIDSNNLVTKIASALPQEEWEFINDLVKETIEDMARFNSSAAGIIANMNINAEGLDTTLTDLFDKVKNREGLEVLSAIQDVNGTRPVVVKKS